MKNPRCNVNMHTLVVMLQQLRRGIHHPHNDPLMIIAQIGSSVVSKILIDTGSAVNVIFKHAFDQMHILGDKLEPSPEPIFGFNNKGTTPFGQVRLPVQVRLPTCSRVIETVFVVIDQLSYLVELPFLLAHRGYLGINVQCMAHDTGVNPDHISVGPCGYILVIS